MPDREPYELKRLLPRHHEIVKRCLLGYTNIAIADELGMSNRSISLITNSPLFQQELSRRRKLVESEETKIVSGGLKQARQILDDNSALAAQTQVDLLCSDEERVKSSAAKDILDRTIGSKVDGAQAVGVVIDAAALELVKETFNQVKRELTSNAQPV